MKSRLSEKYPYNIAVFTWIFDTKTPHHNYAKCKNDLTNTTPLFFKVVLTHTLSIYCDCAVYKTSTSTDRFCPFCLIDVLCVLSSKGFYAGWKSGRRYTFLTLNHKMLILYQNIFYN
jgi:hypothetical protein